MEPFVWRVIVSAIKKRLVICNDPENFIHQNLSPLLISLRSHGQIEFDWRQLLFGMNELVLADIPKAPVM